MTASLKYVATPTGIRFHQSKAMVRHAMGPVGCGKSVLCCMELFRVMGTQKKGPDGFRRTRMVCIRNTYPELLTTTLATWKDLFARPETGRIVHGTPIVHYFEFGDIRSEVLFMSIGSEDDIKKLKSLEATMIWLNESKFLCRSALDTALERTLGRYPKKDYVDITQYGVIMDTNPPEDDHWLYRLFEEDKLKDNNLSNYEIFKYPAALIKENDIWVSNPKAENINNLSLGYDYYLNQVAGKTDEYINVMLCGNYGSSYDGMPVYPEYNDNLHYDPNLKVDPYLPLILGWDFGLTPALAIAQIYTNGSIAIIDEVCTDYMGLTNFLKDFVIPYISSEYKSFKIGDSVGDPSGRSSSALALNEKTTSFTILSDYGFKTHPAATNDFMPRKEAVSRRLSSLSDGLPSLIIGPKARLARKGFNGGYHFRRLSIISSGGETKYHNEANKNKYSHIQDAIQYIALNYDNFKSRIDKKDNIQMMRALGQI